MLIGGPCEILTPQATNTPTITLTPTITNTPTNTFTPSNTPTPTNTPCVSYAYTGAITGTDPVQTGRLVRAFATPVCATTPTSATVNDSDPRNYDIYTFTNTSGAPQCYTVSMVSTCGGSSTGLLTVIYRDSYNPANIVQNASFSRVM